jgi:hypothetical protein
MIWLSHEQCFSRTNKRSARRRPPHPLRRTESNRDLAYLIRTLLRFSAQSRTQAQLADCIGDSQSREARICSVRSDGSSLRLAVVGSVAHLVAKDPGGLPRLRRSWQGPPAGRAGGRIPGALLAAAATGGCGCGVGHGLQAVQLFEDHHLANGCLVRTASLLVGSHQSSPGHLRASTAALNGLLLVSRGECCSSRARRALH